MSLSIYSFSETDQETFINFWSNKYQYSLENLYVHNIQPPLSENSVLNLFHWKNGMRLSTAKLQSVRNNYIALLDNLPELNNLEQGRNYYAQLNGRMIWNLFWLHCINPNLFPIFDQHTYRACNYILNNAVAELSELNDNEKINFYFDTYIQFFNEFHNNENRRIDKAFFMFGRFLKKWY
ncbi:MAG: hypothetical protein M1480_13690 [Bacteroidetes bacterium]|nr:hypothetical protein [Bacteroidota bacterium]MCL5030060.1 hypothetical protein [Bacteroidota bacterium]